MSRFSTLAVSGILAGALCVGTALADTPPLFPIQGVLTDATGDAVDGPTSVRFALYASSEGGTELWEEVRTLDMETGLFSAYLGEVEALDPMFFKDHGDLWLGITIDSDPEMPLVRLGSTSYAAVAQHALEVPDPVVLGPQSCSPGDVVAGVDALGFVVCVADADTLYSGVDFAPSGQVCSGTDLAVGFDALGALQCTPAPTIPADTLATLSCGAEEMVRMDPATGVWVCIDHAADPSAHHDHLSDNLAITPSSVTLAGTSTTLTNGTLDLGSGADDELTAAMVTTLTGGGSADALHSHAAQASSTMPTMLSNKTSSLMSFGGAARYCRDLTESGFSDWRMPNHDEVWHVYSTTVVSDDTSSDYFWTQSMDGDYGNHVGIRFSDGDVNLYGGTAAIFVRCVR